MNAEDKEFFNTLQNEGMEGILKKYIPVQDLIVDLKDKVNKLTKENQELKRCLEGEQ